MDDTALNTFLSSAGWQDAHRSPLAGDASSRSYQRLSRGSETAIVMCAPPAPDDSTARFVALAAHLSEHGIAVPQVMAAQPALGFALLEDLGDAVLAQIVAKDPSREAALYTGAADLTIALAKVPLPDDLPAQTPDSLVLQIDPVVHWYLGATRTPRDPAGDALARTDLHVALRPLLKDLFHKMPAPVFIHRDFHAENLIQAPDGSLGVIDFQDAMAGAPGYDLVSLLEDARRDVSPDLRAPIVAHYAAALDLDPSTFNRNLAILGAQRNLRILGIFARLCLHLNKPQYVDLIPRVWGHLSHDLDHPDLGNLRRAVAAHLPSPTPDFLEGLKSRCGTILTP